MAERSPHELREEIARLRKRAGGPLEPVSGGRSARELVEGDPRIGLILEHMSAVLTETDAEGRIVYVSPSVAQVLGYAPEELIGTQGLALIHEDDLEGLAEAVQRRVEGVRPLRWRVRAQHKDGRSVWFENASWVRYLTPGGELRTLAVTRDVTELVAAEQALRESEERHRIIATTGRDLVIETDARGRLVFASPNTEEVLGFPGQELFARDPQGPIHPDDIERVHSQMTRAFEMREALETGPFRVRHPDGRCLWFEATGLTYERADGTLRFLGIMRDITERQQEELERRERGERMQQAQRLESLGVMAGGIAHDFNNLLTPILGEASLALMDLPQDSPVRARLEKVLKAGHRAAALTHQMLAYAGSEALETRPLDLSRLVEELGELVEGAVSGKTVLAYELAPELPRVNADASRLSQVVMNLISNAAEAVGEGEGRIAVRTRGVDVESARRDDLGHELHPGRYVCFEVEDTGCGMDAETRARIFDPFFTTKFTGRGLGLAAVLGIVRSHEGAIEIESEPGRGTCFRVLFPAGGRPAVAAGPPGARPPPWRSDATVLVVDDDAAVRAFAREVLVRAGLSVLTAADGREAIETFLKHADAIDAVVLDRTLPATSGEDAFEAIRRIRPEVRIVLASGYSEQRAAGRVSGRGLAGFLHKPFLPDQLLAAVRAALRAAS